MDSMKKVLFLKAAFLLITLLVFTACMEKQMEGPALRFKKEIYNFGKVKEGTEIKCNFTFKNIGNANVIIEDVKPTCGCTVADDWSKVVLPGAKGNISVTFFTTGYQGHVAKTIRVITNILHQKDINLSIEGNVLVDIEIKPKNIFLGEVKKNTLELSGDIDIKNHMPKALNITDIVTDNGNTEVQISDINPGKEYKAHITVRPPFKKEHVQETILFKTDNKKIPSFEIKYNYYKPPIIRVYPLEINIPQNNPKEMEIRIIVMSQLDVPVSIENINLSGDNFEYEILVIEKGSHLHIKLMIPPGYSIPEGKNVIISFQLKNAPGDPVYNIPVKMI